MIKFGYNYEKLNLGIDFKGFVQESGFTLWIPGMSFGTYCITWVNEAKKIVSLF